MRARQRDRRETNPAFSTRRLKLGTFQTNLDSGCVMSDLDGRLDITWANTVALARLAEEMEFEALVPVARWQGWGGKTNPQGPGFEAYTWAAGMLLSLIPSVPAIVLCLVLASTCGILVQASSTSFVAISAKTGTSAAVGLYVTAFYIGGTFGGWLPGLAYEAGGWPYSLALVIGMLSVMAVIVARWWKQ